MGPPSRCVGERVWNRRRYTTAAGLGVCFPTEPAARKTNCQNGGKHHVESNHSQWAAHPGPRTAPDTERHPSRVVLFGSQPGLQRQGHRGNACGLHRHRRVAAYRGVRRQLFRQGLHGRGGRAAPDPGLDGPGGRQAPYRRGRGQQHLLRGLRQEKERPRPRREHRCDPAGVRV